MSRRMASVCVVGAGNIGSRVSALLVREADLARITLIDCDVYELANLAGQDVTLRDIGRPKVLAIARYLRKVRPDLEIVTHHEDLACLPLGSFRADLIIGALDSQGARLALNRVARRLGIPWIDGGLDATAALVRVTGYDGHAEAPCAACGVDASDLGDAAPSFPCGAQVGSEAAAPRAPGHLGAIAAGVMATEALRVFRGERAGTILGREVLLELLHRNHYFTSLRRDPSCPLHVCAPAALEPGGPISLRTTLGDLRAEIRGVRVAGKQFSTRRACSLCGSTTTALLLIPVTPLRRVARIDPCPCGGDRWPNGFDVVDRLELARLRGADLRRCLRSIGARRGEVLELESGSSGIRCVELGGGAP